MATFTIRLDEHNYGYVTVQAESRKQAKELAMSMWYEEKIDWSGGKTTPSIASEEDV